MVRVTEKHERRLGMKLLVKGDRCAGPKCVMVRRAYPPGIHGKKRKRSPSEYGELLKEKQKVRFLYGIDDKRLGRYSKEAASQPGIFSINLLALLERRLDNVVFRLGLASSRKSGRHLVTYGHITVNGRNVTSPSYEVRKGDRIGITERSRTSPLFMELSLRLKNYEPPAWLKLNQENRTGEVTNIPEEIDTQLIVDVSKVKEFYSR